MSPMTGWTSASVKVGETLTQAMPRMRGLEGSKRGWVGFGFRSQEMETIPSLQGECLTLLLQSVNNRCLVSKSQLTHSRRLGISTYTCETISIFCATARELQGPGRIFGQDYRYSTPTTYG